MPRRNRNASERIEKKWDKRHIMNLLKQLRTAKDDEGKKQPKAPMTKPNRKKGK